MLAMLAVLGVVLVPRSTPVHAAVLSVTTFDDELTVDGDCSLREAIRAANLNTSVDACIAGTSDDVITLPAGTYTLAISGAAEDAGATGDLDITSSLTIEGDGADVTVVDGAALDRVFDVRPGASLTLFALTVQGGGNVPAPSNGAGVRVTSGALALTDTVVRDNTSAALGGGIYNQSGALRITRSTIHGNTSGTEGGGIAIVAFSPTLELTNSTVSGNSALGNGGGGLQLTITDDENSVLTITNSTISNNANGGIRDLNTSPVLKNTIVGDQASGADCVGSMTSLGHNIDSDGTCDLIDGNDLPGVDPVLGPLQDNGGQTPTHALLDGSPAVDSADDVACPETDQRGVIRPRGPQCDVGAFELIPDAPSGTSTTGVPYTGVPVILDGAPQAISEKGVVVGSGLFEIDGEDRAFRWDGVNPTQDITPDASVNGGGTARDLNEAGEVVGSYDDDVLNTGRGFRWTQGGGAVDIGEPPGMLAGGFDVSIQGIDEAGNVTGRFAAEAGVCGPTQVFLCGFYGTPGQTGEDLTVIGQAPNGFAMVPNDVDLYDGANGIVLGHAETAYTWTPPGVRAQDFVPVQGALGVRRIKAGMIAGMVGSEEEGTVTAAYWTSFDSAPTPIGTLGGAISEANSINSHGWVVGRSETAQGEFHAFVWTPELGMIDLGTLGGANSSATDINDAGQVIGTAENAAGERVPVMWEPDLSPGGGDAIEITIAEGIAVTDDVAVSGAVSIFVVEGIVVGDSVDVGGPLQISVSERIDVTDSVSISGPLVISIVERIAVRDEPSVIPPLLISVQEKVGVADTVALRPPVLISVSESVSVSDEVLLTGPVTILVLESVAVADNVSVVMIGGDDGDGIDAPVDGAMVGGTFADESGVFSDRFTDQHIGGMTLGTILDRGALEVVIADAPSALDGVTVDTSAGPGTAAVAFCPANHLLTFAPSTSATITCGSITIAVEAGEVTLVLPNGELRIPAGATVTVTQDGSTTTVENHADSDASALLIVGGAEISVPPGDSVPLASGCLGDVNGDGIVSLLDGLLVFRALWSRPGDRRWNPAADLNNDDRVTLIDLAIVGASLLEPSCRSR